MTLDPLVSIILLLFILFLIASLIIWHLFSFRELGLRDKERNRTMQTVVARAGSSDFDADYDAVSQQKLDVALSEGVQADATGNKSNKSQKHSKKTSRNKAKRLRGTKSTTGASIAGSSSTFKTPSYGMNSSSLGSSSLSSSSSSSNDVFEQFAQEGNQSIDLQSNTESNAQSANSQSTNPQAQERTRDVDHEAALLKPPKPEQDIFSTSERRDDIWLFHTAEVEPVHPAEDMTKFRQPGGITGESPRSKMNKNNAVANDFDKAKTDKAKTGIGKNQGINPQANNAKTDSDVDLSAVQSHKTTEIRPPVQPNNNLRDSFGNTGDKNIQEKVVRMTNSSSRVAAERLIVDKEIRTTLTEVNQPQVNQPQVNRAQVNQSDPSVNEMPVIKPVKRAKPSQPFKGTVPPVSEQLQQQMKQTLDESSDNVSNVAKEDLESYKNLKNTRSLVSTKVDED